MKKPKAPRKKKPTAARRRAARKITSRGPGKRPGSIELLDLRARFAELESTLNAIRSGEVDALIVNGPQGDQVYSLKGAEQPYREFIEQMGDGAVTLDAAATILYCNRRFADMVGMPLERVIGSSFLERIAGLDRAQVGEMLSGSRRVSANFQLLIGKKGMFLPVRIAISTMESAEGDVRCVVVTDLTEQKERAAVQDALAKLQQSQAELQQQYKEVQEVRQKLENANAAKDEFLAALSHELRTPLTPVLLTVNAIATDPALPPELREDLEMIRRNVELEARLIDDLLDLTRVTRGKLQVARQRVDLHEVLQLALDICQSDRAAKQLTFTYAMNAADHIVSADPVRLQQIFWNLIRNAVKFTPPGGSVAISTRNNDGKIVIDVADTGIGIPHASIGHIFDAFDQGSTDTNRRFGGLGLGLTITRRLVELHGGTITATSPGPARGATFTITLPVIATPAPAAATPPVDHAPATRSLRILLVEDHEDTRRNMARLLSALDHSVVTAQNSAAALQEAGTHSFDLVISDIGLPDESGLELMRKLRQRHGLTGICLSGYGMEEDIARAREAGFVEHLTKPINFERLESVLAQMASQS
jgi:PAS domain S-box-containing protein